MLDSNSKITVATDGATAPKSVGHMSIGVAAFDKSAKLIFQHYENLHWGTNNQAEYLALLKGLKFATENGYKNVTCYVDSELIINQLNKRWKTKNPELKNLQGHILSLIASLKGYGGNITLIHHGRKTNLAKVADKISKGGSFNEGDYLWQLA